MVKFREKNFGVKGGKAWEAYKKNAPALISTAALGISAANLATGRRRNTQAEEHNKQQLDAMSTLTKELKNTAQSMKDVNATIKERGVVVQQQITPASPQPKKKRSLFRW